MKPWLLMDVDGPLNPDLAGVDGPSSGWVRHVAESEGERYVLWLNPWHGEQLLALTDVFDLAWATTWGHDANREVSPVLGLPTDLPVLEWPGGWRECMRRYGRTHRRGCWKTEHVLSWVGSRPFAWFDDEVNRFDRAGLKHEAQLGPALLHRVEAYRGLREQDFATLRAFGESVTATPAAA